MIAWFLRPTYYISIQYFFFKNVILGHLGGAVKHLTLAQIMISRFITLNPTSGSPLSVQSLLWILYPPPSLPHPRLCMLSKINILRKSVILGHPGWLSWLSVLLSVLAQVRISRFVSSSPASCSERSLLGILSLSLTLCSSPTCVLSK